MQKFVRAIPNLLTWLRLVLTIGFLLLLVHCDVEGLASGEAKGKVTWALVLIALGGITDVLDGKIARKYHVTSLFGKMFDPLVDKIMICGGFIAVMLWGQEVTGVAWWMLAVILLRELMVTILRQFGKAAGAAFGANWAGKTKMVFQTLALFAVVVQAGYIQQRWGAIVRDVLLYLAVVFTVFSGITYLPRIKMINGVRTGNSGVKRDPKQ